MLRVAGLLLKLAVPTSRARRPDPGRATSSRATPEAMPGRSPPVRQVRAEGDIASRLNMLLADEALKPVSPYAYATASPCDQLVEAVGATADPALQRVGVDQSGVRIGGLTEGQIFGAHRLVLQVQAMHYWSKTPLAQ